MVLSWRGLRRYRVKTIIQKELVENRDYKKIASEVRRVINLIKEIRGSLGISESL